MEQYSLKDSERTARRQALLRSAEAIFTEKGFDGTTVEAIARRAGMAKGSVYLHFPSKDEIFKALLEDMGSRVLMDVRSISSGPGNTHEKLRKIAQIMLRFHKESRHAWFSLLVRGAVESEELASRFIEQRKFVIEDLAVVLRQGMDTGEIYRDDVQRIAAIFTGCIHGVVIRSMTYGLNIDHYEEADWLVGKLLDGLRSREGERG